MTATPTPLTSLSREAIRQRLRETQLRQRLARRLPLLAWESLLRRLAGLRLQHPAQAGFVQEMTCRAARLRLEQDLETARELEADYLDHLAAQGITETWHDARADEADLLARHYHLLRAALETPPATGIVARISPRPAPASFSGEPA